MRLVITSTPCARLESIAGVLARLGIGCGHETVFGPDRAATPDADASWMAAPFFARLANPLRILQYRHLDTVVDELDASGLFAVDTPERRFALAFGPESWRESPELISVRRWVTHWRELAARHAQVMWSIERLTPSRLVEVLARAGWDRNVDDAEEALAAMGLS
ncbi:hypothetical protein [Nitrosomonas sp.]|uniref:hypothetical protein n=1 Tax=Nitrosomonas sp. TaxID=42353 RepID=UPI0025DDA942|nr:hypothetical protein [Nitrosomonas sp.]MBV6448533.1 hypothetical protein [Nitrosomonas sp.]